MLTEEFGEHFRIELKSIAVKPHALETAAPEHLVARIHVAQRGVIEHPGYVGHELVANVVPEVVRALWPGSIHP